MLFGMTLRNLQGGGDLWFFDFYYYTIPMKHSVTEIMPLFTISMVVILLGNIPLALADENVNKLLIIDVTNDLRQLGIHPQNAVGDGKTDNTKSIQAAIDYVYQNGGGSVVVPPGQYRMESITLMDGVRLTGAGVEQTFFRPPDHNFYAMIKVIGGALENFTIYGTPTEDVSGTNWKVGVYKGKQRGGSSARPVHLIYINDAFNGVDINNVRSFESRYDCLYVRGSKGLRVTNCVFDRAGRNITSMVGNDEDFVFSRCRFGRCPSDRLQRAGKV